MTLLSIAASTFIAPLFALQSTGATAVAIKNDAPETWTVEYPRIITPFVDDYRRCLNVANRRITGEANLEAQHRADLTRCAQASSEAQSEANRVLANRGELEEYAPADVSEVFEHIGRIHVARGADLDRQFLQRLQGAERRVEEYDRDKPKGLVIELRDASVVKAAIDQSQAISEDAAE
uniref:hypothetical protein n=1 Tax=uncultured Erythrobacter sp. TaxID=263913 RepID=UPI00262B7BBC|nr:hypothetical protein [uncultured Erythrobacter sp.]